MKKYDTVRIVTFQEDYYVTERTGREMGKKLLFKKGHKRPMHKDLADQLEKRGVKIKVESFDPKPVEERMKAQLQVRRKREIEMAYMQ